MQGPSRRVSGLSLAVLLAGSLSVVGHPVRVSADTPPPAQYPLGVYAGYADTLRPSPLRYPSPCDGCGNDTAVAMLTNASMSPVTTSLEVDANGSSVASGSATVPAQGHSVVQFGDLSDLSGVGCGVIVEGGAAPVLKVTIAGTATSFTDTAKAMFAGGVEYGGCNPGQNESEQWVPLDGGGPIQSGPETRAPNPSEKNCRACAGDPVDTFTGNFSHSFTDLAISGRGMPLNLSRTYAAQAAAQNGPFGYGWFSSYSTVGLALDASSNAWVTQESGAAVPFIWSGTAYQAPSRVFATLTKNGDGTYTFVRHQRQTFVFSALGQLTAEHDLNGETTTLAYNGSGQLATVTDAAGRTLTFTDGSNGDVAQVTDPSGRTVRYGYDGNGNLTSVVGVRGETWQFGYDASHHLTTMTDPNNGTTTTTYDSYGRVTAQSDPLQRTTAISYTNYQATVTTPKGNVRTDVYSSAGLLRSQTLGVGTPQALTSSKVDDLTTLGTIGDIEPSGGTTERTFDAQGNVLAQIDPLGRTTSFTYDGLNDVTQVVDPRGTTSTSTYDAKGNLIQTTHPINANGETTATVQFIRDTTHPQDVLTIVDPDGKRWTRTYDSHGDVATSTDPVGDTTSYSRNAIGWTMAVVSPRGNVAGGTPSQYTTTWTRDNAGNPLTVTDPLGHVTTQVYDADGNLTSVTDAGGHTTSTTYDADSEPTTVMRADQTTIHSGYDADGNVVSQTDGLGRATTYSFDALDRPRTQADPLGRTTTDGYNAAGDRTTVTQPRDPVSGVSLVTTMSYDLDHELTSITYSDGTTPSVSSIGYDPNGNVASMHDGTGWTTASYDDLNRMTASTNGAGMTVKYVPDLRGDLTQLSYPDATTVNRGYDAAGRLTSVRDPLGNITSFGYDADSNLVSEAYPNGTSAASTVDAAQRTMSITDSGTVAGQFLTLQYQRNADDLLTQEAAAGPPAQTSAYSYTALHQLAQANGAVTTTAYGYDAADNITQMGGQTLAYDGANELTSATGAVGTTTFGYDSRGNRTSAIGPAGTAPIYGYDAADRLTSYNGAATYGYDGAGLRMSKTVGAVTTQFAWQRNGGMPLLLQEAPANQPTTKYIYGAGDVVIEQLTGSTPTYLHQDQLGSTRALTNQAGIVVGTETYDSYGNPTISTGTVTSPFGFSGQYRDAESGLTYLRARYYDPTTAQFLSRDPLVATTRSPYAYVAGDPLNGTDPSGLCWGPGCWVEQQLNNHGYCVRGQDNCDAGAGAQAVSNAVASVDPNLVNNLTDPNPSGVVAFVRNASVLVSLGTDIGNAMAGKPVPASNWAFDALGFIPFDTVAAKGAEALVDAGRIPAAAHAWNLGLSLQGVLPSVTIGTVLDILGLRVAAGCEGTSG